MAALEALGLPKAFLGAAVLAWGASAGDIAELLDTAGLLVTAHAGRCRQNLLCPSARMHSRQLQRDRHHYAVHNTPARWSGCGAGHP
jgi:hypothetical protein